MKWIFLIVVLMHGLIHSVGFVKGFNIAEIKELSMPISLTAGIVWLSAAALFLLYGILFISDSKYAWISGISAVLVSQLLVFLFWKDAWFGTIPNLIVLLVSLVSLGSFLMQSEFKRRVNADFAVNNSLPSEILTEDDIVHLPAIVQKYLVYTRSVGQPKVKNFRAEFTGGMRSKPEDDYMKIHSVQYNFFQNPSRCFLMKAAKMGLPATGLHIYQNREATFVVKLLNWLKVVNARGDKLNQAETVTLLNDMCFIAPATLTDRRINWTILDDTTVNATFINGNISVGAVLYFNGNGELQNFISNDRYETDGKQYNSYPWSTPVENYSMINGYILPGNAKLIYQKPEGDFTYGELEFKSVKYNLDNPEE